jgi:hypothetical protein
VEAFGVDDITLGFDMSGSRCVARLNELPGVMTRRGKMLGDRASWGRWVHFLGRSVSFWKPDTGRLYVQAKLAADGELCRPADVRESAQQLMERMAIVGVTSYEEPWVTRMDVAVDAECPPADGKLLLDALEAVRLPNGWRTVSVGVPRSTVYFKARGTEHVLARAYCRNLKLKVGEPFGRIRLEAEQRFEPRSVGLERAACAEFIGSVWSSRYGGLSSRVLRLAREVQTVRIAELVRREELSYSQGERVGMFLDLERLGLARTYYSSSAYSDRRRLASKLGLSSNESGQHALEIELAELMTPYAQAIEETATRRPSARPEQAAAGDAPHPLDALLADSRVAAPLFDASTLDQAVASAALASANTSASTSD